MDYSLESLIGKEEFLCKCGKTHSAHLKDALVDFGAAKKTAGFVRKYGGTKAYIITDKNTFAAAGERVIKSLDDSGIKYKIHVFKEERLETDEKIIGSAVLHFDYECDIIISIGSGVINDTGKILARQKNLPYIIVGTAPSMDGYASSTSSVIRDGLKVSIDSKCPDVVIGDLDVLCSAPIEMIRSGLGDILAKYISLCEWKISNLVTGEYYCEEIAAMVRSALRKCVENADGITSREPSAVKAVMEGLILSGIAADYAGISRPVSGVEHYYSHLWDMRAQEFGTPASLHGIQCGIGTVLSAEKYERLKNITPDREKAKAHFSSFDLNAWLEKIRAYLGKAGDVMIENAPSSERYNKEKHEQRLENIINNWDEILETVEKEIPPCDEIIGILKMIEAPASSAGIDIPESENELTFLMTKDIRDKYILSTLLFDLGVTEL